MAKFHGQQPLSKEILYSHSRKGLRVTQRACKLRYWTVPRLQILPMPAPIMLTYGNLPCTARIIVSQGLLEKLSDDEIATIYALALGQIGPWDFLVMFLALLVTLPGYKLYQQASTWGNKSDKQIWRWTATPLSSLIYGIWCLLAG